MNNEIKKLDDLINKLEIRGLLEDLQKCIDDGQYEQTLKIEHIKLLLDYITNLQEENKRLVELCNKYEEEHNTAFNLWKMKMEEMPTYEEKENYKSRIDKAIEYLGIDEDILKTCEIYDVNGIEVYKILQGSDK